jgi:hypothetical protein
MGCQHAVVADQMEARRWRQRRQTADELHRLEQQMRVGRLPRGSAPVRQDAAVQEGAQIPLYVARLTQPHAADPPPRHRGPLHRPSSMVGRQTDKRSARRAPSPAFLAPWAGGNADVPVHPQCHRLGPFRPQRRTGCPYRGWSSTAGSGRRPASSARWRQVVVGLAPGHHE